MTGNMSNRLSLSTSIHLRGPKAPWSICSRLMKHIYVREVLQPEQSHPDISVLVQQLCIKLL